MDISIVNKRLNRVLDFNITTVNLINNIAYYWEQVDEFLLPDTNTIYSYIRKSDLDLMLSISHDISYEETYLATVQMFRAISNARTSCAISLYTPLVTAALMTNLFRNVPTVADGSSSNNYYLLSGGKQCYLNCGIMILDTFETPIDCIREVANRYNTSASEAQTFLMLYKNLRFSLALYRVYFILTLLVLKGVDISEANNLVDCTGRKFSNRMFISPTCFTSTIFGQATKVGQRPQGSGQGDSKE